MTVSRTRPIGGVPVAAACAPGQEPLLDDVFMVLERLAPLRSGMRIRFGWSMLTLRSHDQGLIVCEPDFDGDPMRHVRPRIDLTLEVIARQTQFVRAVRATPADVAFDQLYVCARDALSVGMVHLHRDVPTAPDDSGWRISSPPGDREDAPEYEAERIHALVRQRPGLLAVLALPVGFSVVVDGEEIRLVLDEQGRQRLG